VLPDDVAFRDDAALWAGFGQGTPSTVEKSAQSMAQIAAVEEMVNKAIMSGSGHALFG
jgi:hypothetical protein